MDKLIFALTDDAGNNVSVAGYELTPDRLARHIKAGSVTIDGDKLRGNDNFVIEAKRLKCSMVLRENDQQFKNAMLGLVNSPDRLLQDTMEVVSGSEMQKYSAFKLDSRGVSESFSLENLWGSDYVRHGEGQSWSYPAPYHQQGRMIFKSERMRQIIFAMCFNFFTTRTSGLTTIPGAGYYTGAGGTQISQENVTNTSNRGVKIGDYEFDIGFLNLCDFFAKGLMKTYVGDLGSAFMGYLEYIKPGLGTGLRTYVINKLNNMFSESHNLGSLFCGGFAPSGAFGKKDHKMYIGWLAVDKYLSEEIAINQQLQFYTYNLATDTYTGGVRYRDLPPAGMNDEHKPMYRIACFIESLIQYAWYDEIASEFVGNGFQPIGVDYSHLVVPSTKTSCMFLNNCMEAIVGVTDFRAHAGAPALVKYNFVLADSMVFKRNDMNVRILKPIRMLNNRCVCKIGSPKVMTRKLDDGDETNQSILVTEGGYPVVQLVPGNYYDTNVMIFIPAQRVFYLIDSQFYAGTIGSVPTMGSLTYRPKLMLDGFDYSRLSANPALKSYLISTGYVDTNWMFFDNIGVAEELLTYDNNSHMLPRTEIPVFDIDEGNETDNYGLYIYKDFFEKYYTKKRSSLTNIYVRMWVEPADGGQPYNIYTGILDYSTVKHDAGSLSFEATDAIGLLIENLQTLKDFVHFSQHDTQNGYGMTALDAAGVNIRDFIEGIVREPFPYNASLKNPAFTFPDVQGLENKVLDEVSAEDAFVAAVQMSKSVLYCDADGKIQIASFDVNEISNIADIDGHVISKSTSKSIDLEVFSIERVQQVAGWEMFAPDIAAFYNGIRNKYSDIVNIEIGGQHFPIKILDKVFIDNICYLVTEIEYNLSDGSGATSTSRRI